MSYLKFPKSFLIDISLFDILKLFSKGVGSKITTVSGHEIIVFLTNSTTLQRVLFSH